MGPWSQVKKSPLDRKADLFPQGWEDRKEGLHSYVREEEERTAGAGL